MKQILCLSSTPWQNPPSRTQQLMARMRDCRVLFFEPPTGRLDHRWKQPGRRVRPDVTVYTLPFISTWDEAMPLFRMGLRRLERFITDCLDRHRFRDFLLWSTSPAQVHLLDKLPYESLVYDCDREWDLFPTQWEGILAQAADVVFAVSPDLMDRLSPCNANLALLCNGVNYPLFSQSGSGAERLLPNVRGPVFCRAGTIHADLDLTPVLHAASTHPEWTFLLVGKKGANPQLRRLARLDNVLLPGPQPQLELPNWLERCHVCFDLLRLDRPYSDVVPSRIYEYLSTGKPIVSMLWPDQVDLFPDVIYAASSPQEFTRLCQQALQEDRGWLFSRRRSYGAAAAWSRQAGAVRQILTTAGLL